MTSKVLRLVLLLALALMPFSMGGMSAAASAKAAGHCQDRESPADAPSKPPFHCAACAALPASDPPSAIAELRPSTALNIAVDLWVAEPTPEIGTPPPKLS